MGINRVHYPALHGSCLIVLPKLCSVYAAVEWLVCLPLERLPLEASRRNPGTRQTRNVSMAGSKLDIPPKLIMPFIHFIHRIRVLTHQKNGPNCQCPSLWRPKLSKLQHLPCEVVVVRPVFAGDSVVDLWWIWWEFFNICWGFWWNLMELDGTWWIMMDLMDLLWHVKNQQLPSIVSGRVPRSPRSRGRCATQRSIPERFLHDPHYQWVAKTLVPCSSHQDVCCLWMLYMFIHQIVWFVWKFYIVPPESPWFKASVFPYDFMALGLDPSWRVRKSRDPVTPCEEAT